MTPSEMVVEQLRELLARAEQGEITAIDFITTGSSAPDIGMAGYIDTEDYFGFIGMCRMLELSVIALAEDGEDETAH